MSANDEQRERLSEIVQRLTADDHAREVMPGWTIGALLGHLAFWDRLVIERWTWRVAEKITYVRIIHPGSQFRIEAEFIP